MLSGYFDFPILLEIEGEDHRLDGSKRGPFLATYPVEDKMDAISADSFGALILCASRFPDLSSVPQPVKIYRPGYRWIEIRGRV